MSRVAVWRSRGSRAMRGALLACLLGAGAGVPAVAQGVDEAQFEQWASRLLNSPSLRQGDVQATALESLELLETPGAEPLAEAVLLLLHERLDGLDERWKLIEPLAALDAGRFPAGAREKLALILGSLRRDFALAPGAEAFPDYLGRFQALGPLPPRQESGSLTHLDQLARSLAASPDFGGELEGVDGPLRWRELRRSPAFPYIDAFDALRTNTGLCVLAASFRSAGGGPAWIEIRAAFPSSMRSSVGSFPSDLPGYGYSWNEGEFEYRDCRVPAPELLRLPVVLRDGVNRLLLRSRMHGRLRPRFSVRVLDSRGDPLPVVACDGAALGRPVDAQPPADDPFVEVVPWLEERRSAGPNLEALLGTLLTFEGEADRARECLEQALLRAPQANHLKAILALTTDRADYLPEGWRRSRARELAEEVASADPTQFLMQQYMASALAGEDREEEALALLDGLVARYPRSSEAQRQRAQVFEQLGLSVLAEEAVGAALEIAPGNVGALADRARHWAQKGQPSRSAEVLLQIARLNGNQAGDLVLAAETLEQAGGGAQALELYREIEARFPRRRLQLTDALIRMGELQEARERLVVDVEQNPRVSGMRRKLAALELRLGRPEAELEQLLAAVELEPSERALRERLSSLGLPDAATDFFEAGIIPVDEVLADYDDQGNSESRVLVIDHSMTWWFEDGSSERVTQNLYHARDLDGCESLGTIGVDGDLLSLAVLKDRGRERIEPIEVAGEYVLPSLRPGDFVELIWRETLPAPADGVQAPTSWYFASVDQPFHLSRFVVSIPDGLGLRVVPKRLDGIEVSSEHSGGRRVQRFEARHMPRVLQEPGAPPPEWFLPMVAVGSDDSLEGVANYCRAEAEWNSCVRPEIRAAAAEVTRGLVGEEACARALHAFVSRSIDKRAWSPSDATGVLLGREGNATFLYMALLAARDIDHELVWARGAAALEDLEPPPDFLEFGRWRQRPYVLVRPRDGTSAYCDMNYQLLPYAVPTGIGPGAEALSSATGERLQLPEMALEARPGIHVEASLRVADDGSARVQASCRFAAILGYSIKEQVRDLPENARLYNLRGIASRVLSGLEVGSYELPGLDDPSEPMGIRLQAALRTFLDRDRDGYVCKLPIVPLQLGADFAGEGARRLPFFFSSPLVGSFRVRIELPESIELVDAPEPITLNCPGGSWTLSLQREADGSWLLERVVRIGAFRLSPEEYPAFVQFCAAVDNAERGRLRFRRR